MQTYYALASLRLAPRTVASHPPRLVTRGGKRTLATLAQELPHQLLSSTQQETKDITDLDGLLRTVRETTPTTQHNHIPQRAAGTWNDALQLSHPIKPPRVFASPAAPVSFPISPTAERPTLKLVPMVKDPPLPTRRMHDSYSEILLPFSSKPELMDEYVNAWGGLRVGKIMEHLDSVAASSAYKHMLGPGVGSAAADRKFYMVTAACDRLDMRARYASGHDLRVSGQVIYVGRSSMEVVVKVEQIGEGGRPETLLLGRFSMVCRDATTNKARVVNPLYINTPEEKALHTLGEAHKNARQNLALRSLSQSEPTTAEFSRLHNFYLRYGREKVPPALKEGEERVWMGDTKLEMTQLMFPQHRNIHHKVFGGYLMRLAFELGFTNASVFARKPVRFLSLDKIAFSHPVPIGSIVRMQSTVHHSAATSKYPALIHCGVQASVIDVDTGKELTTNDFRFTWVREKGAPLARIVVPRTSDEVMLWFEAQREMELNQVLSDRDGK